MITKKKRHSIKVNNNNDDKYTPFNIRRWMYLIYYKHFSLAYEYFCACFSFIYAFCPTNKSKSMMNQSHFTKRKSDISL